VILLLHGKEQEPAAELGAGEIGAVPKLAHTHTGDTLSTKERPLRLPAMVFLPPTLPVAIEPQTKADLDKMGTALQRMLEEEPSARVERAPTGEQLLVALGEAHIAVIAERLKRKFGAAIVTRTPRVPYRETIRGKTQVEGKYKKQTGGHGMFGHVWLEIEPNPGGGVEFAEKVVGGSVPKGSSRASRRASAKASEGALAGYPVIDFKATLFDGLLDTGI
jgi:elongation factor G